MREEGRLVGYAVYVVHDAMHYAGARYADNDVFFIKPSARKGLVAARFFGYIEEQLKKEKVDLIINKIKEKYSEAMGAFFSRLGYEKAEIVYTKLVS
jgi:GNAT superfamily N-acetyltransferase